MLLRETFGACVVSQDVPPKKQTNKQNKQTTKPQMLEVRNFRFVSSLSFV